MNFRISEIRKTINNKDRDTKEVLNLLELFEKLEDKAK